MLKILVYRFLSFLVLSILVFSPNVKANSINLMFKQAPMKVQKEVEKALPSVKDRKDKASLLPKLSGFISLYGGYVDYSNPDGSVRFPLLHAKKANQNPQVMVIITPKIDLVTVHGNTISHKKIVKGEPTKIFLFEKKKNTASESFYWQVKKVDEPKDNNIPPTSIIILTDPDNIVVPTGDFMTSSNPNFVLPDFYIVGNKGNAAVTNYFWDIRRHFEQIEQEEKVVDSTKQQLIKNR